MPGLESKLQIHWFEQTAAAVLQDDTWLTAAECEKLNGLRVAKRRADWRLGRWTAKCALASVLHLDPVPDILREFELRPLPGGAPRVYRSGLEIPIGISLSHRGDRAACAVAPSGVAAGCDLEIVERRSDAFTADYFSAPERERLGRAVEPDRSVLANLYWSAKESALKAMGVGLNRDTRDLTVTIDSPSSTALPESRWLALQVVCSRSTFDGWYQRQGSLIRTLVATSACSPPIQVRPAGENAFAADRDCLAPPARR